MANPIDRAKAEMMVRKPIEEVFEAFIDPEITSKFWFTSATAKLKEGENLIWTWEMYNLNVPLKVEKVVPNERILIEWGEGEHKSKVKWEFKSLRPDKTFVSIENFNFQGKGEQLMAQVVDSTAGFTLVIAGLKAWLEHGIQLNLVGDKFPKEMM